MSYYFCKGIRNKLFPEVVIVFFQKPKKQNENSLCTLTKILPLTYIRNCQLGKLKVNYAIQKITAHYTLLRINIFNFHVKYFLEISSEGIHMFPVRS